MVRMTTMPNDAAPLPALISISPWKLASAASTMTTKTSSIDHCPMNSTI
ncbi:Uncharacterised protein [Bordetella pertussis]|nr:Uncharacterised protein [Bordetella pertussis]